MKKERKTFFVLCLIICSSSSSSVKSDEIQIRRNATRNSIKDIKSIVNDIYDIVHKIETIFDLNFKTSQIRFDVFEKKIEKIDEIVNYNKLTNNLFVERLNRIESNFNSFEKLISDQIMKIFNEKMKSIENLMKNFDDSIDSKLRKSFNVQIQIYEFTKDLKNIFENVSQQSKTVDDNNNNNNNDDNDDEMKKLIKEQLSVLSVEFKNQINFIQNSIHSLRSQFDVFGSQLLEIQDDLPKNALRKQTSSSIFESNQFEELKKLIEFNRKQIMSEIDVKISSIKLNCEKEGVIGGGGHRHRDVDGGDREKETNDEKKWTKSIDPMINDKSLIGGEDCVKTTSMAKNCQELKLNGVNCNGVYQINFNRKVTKVYCDMKDNDGGWTVIMRRGNFNSNEIESKRISFDQNWHQYKSGFGDFENEFWLGNELIHLLTKDVKQELQIDLQSFDDEFISLRYSWFCLNDENDAFRLLLGTPKFGFISSSNLNQTLIIASSFLSHNDTKFSTFDRNNSENSENCGSRYKGGWWFDLVKCFYVFLNGPYFKRNDQRQIWQGIQWNSWKSNQILKAAQMKIRPII